MVKVNETIWTNAFMERQIVQRTPEAIIISDTAGTIRFWNEGAERVFGFSRTEALGASLDIIIPEKHREPHWKGWKRVLDTGQSHYAESALLRVPGLRKDGTRISLAFSVFILRANCGDIVGMGATLRDVTDDFMEIKKLRSIISDLEQNLAPTG